MDFVCSFYDAKVDRISGKALELSRLCRCTEGEMIDALHELSRTFSADIEEVEGVYTVVCRRLKRQQELSKKRSNSAAKRQQSERMPVNEDEEGTLRVLKHYAVSLNLPATDGEACFHKWEANGWTNGGNPIRDWRSTMRSWKDWGYMPSQKAANRQQNNGSKPQSERQLKREREIEEAQRRYDETRTSREDH